MWSKSDAAAVNDSRRAGFVAGGAQRLAEKRANCGDLVGDVERGPALERLLQTRAGGLAVALCQLETASRRQHGRR